MGKGDRNHRSRKAGPRTPSGALSRSKQAQAIRRREAEASAFEQDVRQPVLMARNRQRKPFTEPENPAKWRQAFCQPVDRIKAKERKLDARGSVLGRLAADGHITPEMQAAGEGYCERYLAYAAHNGLPRPTAQGSAFGEVRGNSRPERLRLAVMTKAEHMTDQTILSRCSAGVTWAIKRACVTDDEAPLHLVREGLLSLIANGR